MSESDWEYTTRQTLLLCQVKHHHSNNSAAPSLSVVACHCFTEHESRSFARASYKGQTDPETLDLDGDP